MLSCHAHNDINNNNNMKIQYPVSEYHDNYERKLFKCVSYICMYVCILHGSAPTKKDPFERKDENKENGL